MQLEKKIFLQNQNFNIVAKFPFFAKREPLRNLILCCESRSSPWTAKHTFLAIKSIFAQTLENKHN